MQAAPRRLHRLGFGQSRPQARQLVCHGHITGNGHRVDIPSYPVRVGDVIRVKNRPKSLQLAQANLSQRRGAVPDYLSFVEGGIPEGHVMRMPDEQDFSLPVQTQLIVEVCSR